VGGWPRRLGGAERAETPLQIFEAAHDGAAARPDEVLDLEVDDALLVVGAQAEVPCFAISESAASSRGSPTAPPSVLGDTEVAAPLAFVRCRACAQCVITRRTPARPESIRAGDASCRRIINPFRRSHIFAVGAA
jgi:hypothetical protein